jgi:hypothetical protein
MNPDSSGFHAGRIAGGLIILAFGILMMLDQQAVLGGDGMRFFPGAVLVLLGTVQLLGGGGSCSRRGRRRSGFGGVWLIFVGAWLMANQGHLFGLTFHTSWPLLVIGVGVMMVMRELFQGTRPADGPSDSQGR